MKFQNSAMAFLLSSFFIFSTVSLPINYTSTPLLSLWCNASSSSNQTNLNPIKTLLDNLTTEAPKSHFSTMNATFSHEHYTGLMQCRPDENCTLCAKTARATILNLCRNSNAVSAWFDGCYVQISSHNSHSNILNYSCSGRTSNQDPARFQPALGALFLKLRADVYIPTHHEFSYQEIGLGLGPGLTEGKIYGLVECVRSLSPKECDSCIEKAVEMLFFYCGGKDGATMVNGLCLVRFDSSEFYHGVNFSTVGGLTGNSTIFTEGENGGRVKELVMEYWISGVVCFLLFILILWLLRRRALNTAKVGSLDHRKSVFLGLSSLSH